MIKKPTLEMVREAVRVVSAAGKQVYASFMRRKWMSAFGSRLFSPENRVRFLVGSAFVAGFFLHFRNLDGARILDPDEERAYALLPSGPFIYLLCRPLYSLTQSESSGFYIAATLGFVSIILFYFISRILTNKWNSAISTLVFAVFPARISYARTLFPSVFIDFFILLLVLLVVVALIRKKEKEAIFAGLLSMILISVHPSVYFMLSGLCMALGLLWVFNREFLSLKKILTGGIMFILGLAGGYFLLEMVFMRLKEGYSFSGQFLNAYSTASDYSDVYSVWGGLQSFFGHLWRVIFVSPLSVFRAFYVFFAVGFAFRTFFAKKKDPVFYFIVYACFGLGVFLIGNIFGAHRGFEYRNLIWLCPVISWCAGYFCVEGFSSRRSATNAIIVFCAGIFIISSFVISYKVTTETYKTDMLNDWLRENNIPKRFLTTNLRIGERGDAERASGLPLVLHKEWTRTDNRYQIVWPLVHKYYQLGRVFYIVPSGIGGHAHLEKDDILFQGVTPIRSWPHPYTNFKYRFPFRNKTNKLYESEINVYKLSDIFDLRRPVFRGSIAAEQ